MPALRAAELEVLYTANTTDVDKGEQKVKASAQRIESKAVTQKVNGDASAALADLDRVATEAKKLVSERAVLQLDADITRTDKALERARGEGRGPHHPRRSRLRSGRRHKAS